MLHIIILKILHLCWLVVPFPIYALYNKNYLDHKEAELLIIQSVSLLSLMTPGWIMHPIRLVTNGFYVFIVLDLCIIQYEEFIHRYQVIDENNPSTRRTKVYRQIKEKPIFMIHSYRTLKKFKFKETFFCPIFVLFWILIKMYFTKVKQYGIGLQLFDGTSF